MTLRKNHKQAEMEARLAQDTEDTMGMVDSTQQGCLCWYSHVGHKTTLVVVWLCSRKHVSHVISNIEWEIFYKNKSVNKSIMIFFRNVYTRKQLMKLLWKL